MCIRDRRPDYLLDGKGSKALFDITMRSLQLGSDEDKISVSLGEMDALISGFNDISRRYQEALDAARAGSKGSAQAAE